ncbi:MAG: cytochrome c biogenesis protein CcsA [Planctomycetota bacterium]|jgi:cytochrome c-type biogenesis protein CcsB
MFEIGILNHPWVAAIGALHGAALVVSAPATLLGRKRWISIGLGLLIAALALNTWLLAYRWIEAGRPPFKTLFETLVFYPWCLGAVTLGLVLGRKLFVLVPFSAGMSLAGVVYALYKPDVETVLLPPALQSGWFIPHVVTYFVSYAALFASCALAIVALWARARARADADESARAWEGQAHFAAVFGLGALTFGLVMGAVWGKYAWGDYWGWDPKENWALVTWLAYMIYVHLRLMDGWNGRRAMVLLVASFAAVVFTYLGMNMLPTAEDSMHVYQ